MVALLVANEISKNTRQRNQFGKYSGIKVVHVVDIK